MTFNIYHNITSPEFTINQAPDLVFEINHLVIGGGSNATKTSELLNDGADGVHPFITVEEITDKVDKVAGKGLSTNDYDDAAVLEVAKIADKADSADVYTKSETYTQTEINNKLSSVYEFKGTVDYFEDLPIDAENADVYNVRFGVEPIPNGVNYAWVTATSSWDDLGRLVGLATLTENGLMSKEDFLKLSELYPKVVLDNLFDQKEPTITPTVDTNPVDTDEVITKRGGVWLRTTFANWIVKLLTYFYSKTQSEQKYVAQNGGTIYHNTKWFTPTAGQTLTINANGTQATMSGGTLFTAAMTGAKLRVVGSESEPIITYQSTTVINLSPALDSSLFGQVVAFGNWGVHLSEFMFDGDYFNFYYPNKSLGRMFLFLLNLDNKALISSTTGVVVNKDLSYSATGSVNQYDTVDISIKRIASGIWQIFDGITSGTYRDLALRWVYQSIGTSTGDAIGDKRTGNVNGIQVTQTCTVANATKGSGTWVDTSAINEYGGVMIPLINKTGVASVKGTVVSVSDHTDNAFKVNIINSGMPFGVVYNSGIADGSNTWIVVSGVAEVLLVDGVATTRNYMVYASGTTAGRVDSSSTAPASIQHFRECGHSLESKAAGTNVLCKCVLHFN